MLIKRISMCRILVVTSVLFFLSCVLQGEESLFDLHTDVEAAETYPVEIQLEEIEEPKPEESELDHRTVSECYLVHPLEKEETPLDPPAPRRIEFGYQAIEIHYVQPPEPPPEPMVCPLPPPPSHLWALIPSIGYTAGPGRSYQRGYESVEAFIGRYALQERSYWFLDARFHHVQSDEFAENIGLGWRKFSVDFQQMFGANVFYDLRRFSDDYVQQIGVGFELLGSCWDIRGNGYFPIGEDRIDKRKTRFDFPSGFFAERTAQIAAMWGFDLTLGAHLCTTCCFDLYAALGTYAYDSRCCHHVLGELGRLSLEVGKWWEAELLVTHDELFNTKVQGVFTLRLPFGCFRDCWECLFEPVRRNDIIITERICTWTRNF